MKFVFQIEFYNNNNNNNNNNKTCLMASFQDNLDKPLPECHHSGI